jgi:hypothetical protein
VYLSTSSKTSKNKRPLYTWVLQGHAVEALLKAMLPFLKIKQVQAQAALTSIGAPLAVRVAMRKKLSSLRSKGVPGVTDAELDALVERPVRTSMCTRDNYCEA